MFLSSASPYPFYGLFCVIPNSNSTLTSVGFFLFCLFPLYTVDVVCSSLPDLYVEKVLEFLASAFEISCHLEFYLIWAHKLLMLHGQKLKTR